jgi:AcrR family transcriptional regulator
MKKQESHTRFGEGGELKAPTLPPRHRLIEAAVELFATRGIDAVTVRDITRHAKVNLAGVNYYFESKDALLRQVFAEAVQSLTTLILHQLTEYEASLGEATPELEKILRVMVEPLIYSLLAGTRMTYLAQIYVFCIMWPPSALTTYFDGTENDVMFTRIGRALARALPEWSPSEINWATYFATGSLFTATRDTMKGFHYSRLTRGECETGNPDVLIEQVLLFLKRGFTK